MLTLAQAITHIRKRQGKTMVKFAESLGLKQATISLYENGKLIPSRSVLIMLHQMAQEGPERDAIVEAMGGKPPSQSEADEEEFLRSGELDDAVVLDKLKSIVPLARERYLDALRSLAAESNPPLWLIELLHLYVRHAHIPEAQQDFIDMFYFIQSRLLRFDTPPARPKKKEPAAPKKKGHKKQ